MSAHTCTAAALLVLCLLVGCQSAPKPTPAPGSPRPRMSAAEIFNLRTKCQELTEKWQGEGFFGATGAALTSQVESHYDPVTNHCYAKVTVTKNFGYVDTRPSKDRTPDDYLTISLCDVQTKQQLLIAIQEHSRKSAIDHRKGEDHSASFDAVQAEIDRLMNEE
jgi:hypothetical protein